MIWNILDCAELEAVGIINQNIYIYLVDSLFNFIVSSIRLYFSVLSIL